MRNIWGVFFTGTFWTFHACMKTVCFCIISVTVCLAGQVLIWFGAHCSNGILGFSRCSIFSCRPSTAKFPSLSGSVLSWHRLRGKDLSDHASFCLACSSWGKKCQGRFPCCIVFKGAPHGFQTWSARVELPCVYGSCRVSGGWGFPSLGGAPSWQECWCLFNSYKE